MKRLSEVCKMVGVTRKTLQQYNDIGLLKPTVKTEGGYWLYDDESIQMLMTIQVFVEAGYKRAEIKPLLTAKQDELPEILTDAIEKLKAKRARICQTSKALDLTACAKLSSTILIYVI